nr:reverse transcriptase domain-containing protein [Tanacetum cinerariifolium]
MRTRSSSNLVGESYSNATTSNPKRRNRRRSKQPFSLEESPLDTMADQRTIVKLLRAPTEGYAEAIVVPPILAEHFELKHSLINMMTSDQFFGLEKDYPHDHIPNQDSLKSATGGNLLERRTQDVLTIIENKSKQTSDVTTAMTVILKQFQATPPPASVKAIKEICVNCGGAHPYYQCLAADGNTFLEFWDNIQGYISAATVNYNQGNAGYRPSSVANQIQPPGFAQPNLQNNQNRFSHPQGYNRGNNLNQDKSYQAPTQQNQVVPLSELEKIKKINEEDERAEETLTDLKLAKYTIKVPPPFVQKAKPLSLRDYVVHQRDPRHPNIPYPSRMNQENSKTKMKSKFITVILKKLPEKLGDPGKILISCDFSELKCKALANLANQDSLKSAASGNLLERRTQDVLTIIENKSKIAKLTHAVNQQTSDVTTAMTVILKQFQATPPPASVKAIEEICVNCGGAHIYYQCLAADGNTFLEFWDNIQGYVSAATFNYNQGNAGYRPSSVANQIQPPGFTQPNVQNNQNRFSHPQGYNRGNNFNQDKSYQAPTQQNQVVPLIILKKLPEKLGDPGKILISCGFSKLKCKALANLGDSINLMPLSVWKKLGLPELISTRMTLELVNRAICIPARNARDVFVPIRKLTFLVDFVIVDYESDPRVPLILGRPFLENARALIDVHGEEMILRYGDERLTLNMTHDTSSYSNQPHKESINMINIYNDSYEDYLEDLFATNHLKYFLNHDPTKEMDSILEDSTDKCNLEDPNNDLVKLESDNDDVYDDPFDSKKDKIKESKLLIDELDPPISSDFLPSSECDSVLYEDFFKDCNLPLYELPNHKEVSGPETLLLFSFKNEEKVFHPEILTSKGVHTSLLLELSHQGPKAFKEKLLELAYTPLNENCSAVILKKLPEKLGDPGSDPRVPLILGRPFLQTARALIDVHGEKIILRDGDERLTLNMRHDTLSYSNQPQKESINLINVFNDSKGGNVLPKKFLDLDSTKDLHPPHHVSTSTSSSPNQLLEEFADELTLITFPPEMMIFLLISKKIKESKLLIDELDLPSDFLFPSEYDLFFSKDFYEADVLPSTNNKDKVFNPGILIQETLFEVITRVAPDKSAKKLAISHASLILEDFDPPLNELHFFKEVP